MTQRLLGSIVALFFLVSAIVGAHSGPPYPIVSDRVEGPYRLSIWTDPDTTDDGSPGGQFWVTVEMAMSAALPPQTHATLAIRPLGRPGPDLHAAIAPIRGDIKNQFAALLMDHEGRFAVDLTIEGPAGEAVVSGEVQATYDLRPSPFLLVVYVLPFVLAGLLWARLIIRRRDVSRTSRPSLTGDIRGGSSTPSNPESASPPRSSSRLPACLARRELWQ